MPLTLGLHLCSHSMRWGARPGTSGCPCPGPRAPGVGEAGEAAGQQLGLEGRVSLIGTLLGCLATARSEMLLVGPS